LLLIWIRNFSIFNVFDICQKFFNTDRAVKQPTPCRKEIHPHRQAGLVFSLLFFGWTQLQTNDYRRHTAINLQHSSRHSHPKSLQVSRLSDRKQASVSRAACMARTRPASDPIIAVRETPLVMAFSVSL
jgi:hypothetical protein